MRREGSEGGRPRNPARCRNDAPALGTHGASCHSDAPHADLDASLRERPRFAQWRASAFVDYTKGYDGPGRKSIEDDPAAERQTKQFGYRNDVWTNVDDARAEVKYLLTDGKGESTKDLELMLQRAGVALTSYIELAPPADIAEARASAASRK